MADTTFALTRFENRNSTTSWRISGWLASVRIRKNFKTREEAAADMAGIGMSLDDDITTFLSAAEHRPAASKLEPYTELIRTLRQRRWTFQEIAAALRDRFSLSVAPSTVHNFIKVRTRRKPVIDAPIHDRAPASPSTQRTATKRPRFHLDA